MFRRGQRRFDNERCIPRYLYRAVAVHHPSPSPGLLPRFFQKEREKEIDRERKQLVTITRATAHEIKPSARVQSRTVTERSKNSPFEIPSRWKYRARSVYRLPECFCTVDFALFDAIFSFSFFSLAAEKSWSLLLPPRREENFQFEGCCCCR